MTLNDRLRASHPKERFILSAGLIVSVCASSIFTHSLGCGGGQWTVNVEGRDRTIIVPSTASVQPPYNSDGTTPPRRYVVRMSDGTLDWEVELPEVATGYELRIPIKGKTRPGEVTFSGAALTDADKDLLNNLRRKNPDFEGEGVYDEGGRSLTPQGASEGAQSSAQKSKKMQKNAQPAPTRQSYLINLEKSRQLFKAGKYELALVALKSLDQQYPNDVTIKSMIGTLWLQLNQPELAREAWESALKIDPNNRTIIEALKQLEAPSRGLGEQKSSVDKKRRKRRLIRRRRVPKKKRSPQ
jgi:hypothetical protein